MTIQQDIQSAMAAGNYTMMYQRIQAYVDARPQSYSAGLRTWLRAATFINSPGDRAQNPLKLSVWETNNQMSQRLLGHGVSDATNGVVRLTWRRRGDAGSERG